MLFTFIYSIKIYIIETFLWNGGGAPKIDGHDEALRGAYVACA